MNWSETTFTVNFITENFGHVVQDKYVLINLKTLFENYKI